METFAILSEDPDQVILGGTLESCQECSSAIWSEGLNDSSRQSHSLKMLVPRKVADGYCLNRNRWVAAMNWGDSSPGGNPFFPRGGQYENPTCSVFLLSSNWTS